MINRYLSDTIAYDSMHHEYDFNMTKNKTLKPMRRVTLTVNPDDYAAIDRLARKSNVSASWLIRRSMREFLELHDGECSIEIPIGREAK